MLRSFSSFFIICPTTSYLYSKSWENPFMPVVTIQLWWNKHWQMWKVFLSIAEWEVIVESPPLPTETHFIPCCINTSLYCSKQTRASMLLTQASPFVFFSEHFHPVKGVADLSISPFTCRIKWGRLFVSKSKLLGNYVTVLEMRCWSQQRLNIGDSKHVRSRHSVEVWGYLGILTGNIISHWTDISDLLKKHTHTKETEHISSCVSLLQK